MKGALLASVVFITISSALSQSVTLNSVALAGDSDRRGRLEATIVTTTGPVSVTTTTTVCGPIDITTAFVLCVNLGFLAPTEFGTVTQLSVPQGSGVIQIRNLNCSSGTTTLSSCSFSQALISSCTHDQDAALACSITPGEAAGIAIGVIVFCLALILIPIIIACCCCCGVCVCLSRKNI